MGTASRTRSEINAEITVLLREKTDLARAMTSNVRGCPARLTGSDPSWDALAARDREVFDKILSLKIERDTGAAR